MSEHRTGIVVTSQTSSLHAIERALEAIRDTSSRRSDCTPSLEEDTSARYFSGSYIGRALTALLNNGLLPGRIYVAVNPKQALPYATKWIIDNEARREAIRYTADRLSEIGVSEQDVEAYLMHPILYAFGEGVADKLVSTNGDRGYLATRLDQYLCLADLTPETIRRYYEQYGVNLLVTSQQIHNG